MSTTELTRPIRAPRPNVYAALLDHAAAQRWRVPDGMTSQVHAFDATPGGTFRISLTYDVDTGTGKSATGTDTFHDRFVELVDDTTVVQAVEFETDDPSMQGEVLITSTRRDVPGGTEVAGRHEHLPPGVDPADTDEGWSMSMDKLAALGEAS